MADDGDRTGGDLPAWGAGIMFVVLVIVVGVLIWSVANEAGFRLTGFG